MRYLQKPKSVMVISLNKYLNSHRKEGPPPKPEEPNITNMRRVLEFDVESPPTSPNTDMSLPPTPRDPFKQGTTPDNANYPMSPSQTVQQTHHPSMRIPHQHQVTPSKVAVLWKLGPQYRNRRSKYLSGTF